jgi:hypothetical protein
LKDLLPQILAYVSSPFRLFAIVIMAVLTFIGYFVWQNQGLMLDAYTKSKQLPSMNSYRYDDAAKVIFKGTNADLVVIFSVNPLLGTRIVERAYQPDKRYKEFDGYDVGLFTANISNNNDIIKLMANEIPCGEYNKAQSEIGLWYKSIGINYTCRISVPPDTNKFIGQITVGWKTPPESPEAMLSIASSMLMRK